MSYLRELIKSATPFGGKAAARERQLRKDLARFGKMLHSQGFVAATDGNLSVRLDDNRVLVTPTGFSKGMMEPEDMVVVDLHGKTTYATGLDCGRRYELAWVKKRFDAEGRAPDCEDCGGYVKTATISFGQAMPEAAMRRAEALCGACDLFLTIGSSRVVWPAAGLPLLAKQSGARLVILNRDPTDFDGMADLVIRADIGRTLEPFIVH